MNPPPFTPPTGIQGWLYYGEAEALHNLAFSKKVLELGSFSGKSTIVLARVASFVHTVDYHKAEWRGQPIDTLSRLRANLLRYHVQDKVAIHVMDTKLITDVFQPHSFDLIFVDANHTREGTLLDLQASLTLIRPGGYICIHDYNRPTKRMQGVRQAVDFLFTPERIRVVQSMAIVQENGDSLLS